MVRKFFIELAAVIALLANGVIYPSTMVITHVDYFTDTVIVENATGFQYHFEGVEDLIPGDVVSVVMYNNGTPWTIEDDQVVSARYSGFIKEYIQNVYLDNLVYEWEEEVVYLNEEGK